MPTALKEKIKKTRFIKNSNGHNQQEFDTASITKLKNIAVSDHKSCLETLNTEINGLSAEEVHDRLETFGQNEVINEKAPAWYIQLLQAFVDPFIAVLFILA